MSGFARRLQSASGSVVTLYVSPKTDSLAVGDTVVMIIREDSYSVGVNTVQANLAYSTSLLRMESIDTSTSAFTTTIQSNNDGNGGIQIGVGLLAGSLTGDQLVAKVTFTALATGTATVNFVTGSGIADAATSNDVCKKKVGATYTVS